MSIAPKTTLAVFFIYRSLILTVSIALDFFVAEGEKDWTNDAADFKLVGTSASGVLHGGMLAANSAADVSAAMLNQSASLDWRSTFTREGPVGSDLYRLRIRYADGFSAKLNGTLFVHVGTFPSPMALQTAS